MKMMEIYEKGKKVWFDPGCGYYIPGDIVEENRIHKSLLIQSNYTGKNHVYEVKLLSKVFTRSDMPADGVDDMICLSDLSEGSLLWNLKTRYENNQIYTYTGSILIAVNPYKMFDIYNLDMVKKYENHLFGTLPPHLFAIGSAAYSKMMKDSLDQVIVISGESGAGKTESTKLIMQYLAAVNRAPSNTITEQILEANPLLESFGNAKTTRNDNSSRFGKYLEVFFKDGLIIGANISEYLLEKSRIVSQATDERNYHIFYEMLTGLTDDQKQKYGLLEANKYFYLNQGGNCKIEFKDDGEDFHSLISAIDILGFTKQEQDTIFKMLASVLHIGNIYFNRKQDKNYHDTVEIGSDAEIKWASYLLSISDNVLRQKLTHKITEARDEKVLTPFNIDQALDARDAIAKAIYSRLFTWLVEKMNNIICKETDRRNSIAILDIFGFENFATNGFEQLCINYANETLQFYFNKHIFKLEQEEYVREKINWKNIDYTDNKPCIDLISKKPNGIIHILDDESSFPRTTDYSFLEKCHFLHGANPLYNKPRMSTPEFSIKHYAGEVIYEVRNFLDKNRDLLRPDVIDMFINSRNPLLSKMFRDLRENHENQRSVSKTGRFVTMKPKTPTVAAKFHDSLTNLLEAMSKCNPFFVRCIKPNNSKMAMTFEMKVVLEQLCYTGMLETIRIRKLGYPIRYKFSVFVARYRPLMSKKPIHCETSKDISFLILSKLDPKYKLMYQIGLTKVFLREQLDQYLEQQRIVITRKAAILIQKNLRMFIARQKYLKLRSSVIVIQSNIKSWLERNRYQKMKNGFIKAQAQFRMLRERERYARIKDRMKEQRDAQTQNSPDMDRKTFLYDSSKSISFNLLDIPAELAFIYSKLDDWQEVHSERNLALITSHVIKMKYLKQLPPDINSFSFNKFIQIYIKENWERTLTPLTKPFLSKSNVTDIQESLNLFKMILRCVNSNEFDSKRDKILADYIIQKGLMNSKIRDEIFIQIINQTWNNEDTVSNLKAWQLMANCLSCFTPSPCLFKYLMKYASDHAEDGYKAYCQMKLLQSGDIEAQLARTYPPSYLEWKAAKKCANLSLEVNFADEEKALCQLNSWSTGEEFCKTALDSRGVTESNGWTLSLQDESDFYELMGYDYVFDLISEMEIAPAFPVCKSFFLVTSDRSEQSVANQKRKSLAANSHNPDSVYNWYLDVHQSQKSKDRVVLTNAIKGNNSNSNLSASNLNNSNCTNVASPMPNNYNNGIYGSYSTSMDINGRNDVPTPYNYQMNPYSNKKSFNQTQAESRHFSPNRPVPPAPNSQNTPGTSSGIAGHLLKPPLKKPASSVENLNSSNNPVQSNKILANPPAAVNSNSSIDYHVREKRSQSRDMVNNELYAISKDQGRKSSLSDISRSNYITNEMSEKPKTVPLPLPFGNVNADDTDDIYQTDAKDEDPEPKMIYYSEEPESALNKAPARPLKKPGLRDKEMSTGTKLKIKRKEKLKEASTGSIRSAKKQKFRFRFEPNKSSLTKIVLKDSHSASETPSINSTLMSQGKLKACGALNDEEEPDPSKEPDEVKPARPLSQGKEFPSAIPKLIPMSSNYPTRKNTISKKSVKSSRAIDSIRMATLERKTTTHNHFIYEPTTMSRRNKENALSLAQSTNSSKIDGSKVKKKISTVNNLSATKPKSSHSASAENNKSLGKSSKRDKATLSKCSKLNTRYVKKSVNGRSSLRGKSKLLELNDTKMSKLAGLSQKQSSLIPTRPAPPRSQMDPSAPKTPKTAKRTKLRSSEERAKTSGTSSIELIYEDRAALAKAMLNERKLEHPYDYRKNFKTPESGHGRHSTVLSDLSEANTIQAIPIPNSKSDVEAFLDDIFDRALDNGDIQRHNAKAKGIQRRIKGGKAHINNETKKALESASSSSTSSAGVSSLSSCSTDSLDNHQETLNVSQSEYNILKTEHVQNSNKLLEDFEDSDASTIYETWDFEDKALSAANHLVDQEKTATPVECVSIYYDLSELKNGSCGDVCDFDDISSRCDSLNSNFKSSDANTPIIPNKDYEYSKILKVFLKNKPYLVRLSEKNKNLFNSKDDESKKSIINLSKQKDLLSISQSSITSTKASGSEGRKNNLSNVKEEDDDTEQIDDSIIDFSSKNPINQNKLKYLLSDSTSSIFKSNWNLLSNNYGCFLSMSQSESASTVSSIRQLPGMMTPISSASSASTSSTTSSTRSGITSPAFQTLNNALTCHNNNTSAVNLDTDRSPSIYNSWYSSSCESIATFLLDGLVKNSKASYIINSDKSSAEQNSEANQLGTRRVRRRRLEYTMTESGADDTFNREYTQFVDSIGCSFVNTTKDGTEPSLKIGSLAAKIKGGGFDATNAGKKESVLADIEPKKAPSGLSLANSNGTFVLYPSGSSNKNGATYEHGSIPSSDYSTTKTSTSESSQSGILSSSPTCLISSAVPNILPYPQPSFQAFIDPNQVAIMQAVYTQLAQQQQQLIVQHQKEVWNSANKTSEAQQKSLINSLQKLDEKNKPTSKSVSTNGLDSLTDSNFKSNLVELSSNNTHGSANDVRSGSKNIARTDSINSSKNGVINGVIVKQNSRKENLTNAANASFMLNYVPPAPPLPPFQSKTKAMLNDLQGRAKTVRIGKVRWPPPLKESETFENELQRRLALQRRIQEEILTSADACKISENPPIISKLNLKMPFGVNVNIVNNSNTNQQGVEVKKLGEEHALALKKVEEKLKAMANSNNDLRSASAASRATSNAQSSDANITTVEVVANKNSQQMNSIFDSQKLVATSNQLNLTKKQTISTVLMGPTPFSPHANSGTPTLPPLPMSTTIKQAELFVGLGANSAANGVAAASIIAAAVHQQLTSTSGADVSHKAHSKSESIMSPSKQQITEITNLEDHDYSVKMETTASAPSISVVTKSTTLNTDLSLLSRKPMIGNVSRHSSKRQLNDKCKITGSFRSSSNQNSIYYSNNNNSTNATHTSVISMSETRSNLSHDIKRPISIKKNQVNRSTSISGYDMDGLIKSGVKRSLVNINCDENLIETKLFEQVSNQYYTYTRVQWSLHMRKEVFSPTEKLETPLAIDLIFMQILRDYHSTCCIRIGEADKLQLRKLLESKNLTSITYSSQVSNFKLALKKQIIDLAKTWPLYFCRLFPVAGNKQYSSVQMLGISHSGIRLIKRDRNLINDNLVSIEHYSLWDIREVIVPKGSTINLIVNKLDKKIVLYSHRANQIKNMIDAYCSELDKETRYVQAVRDYITNEDGSLLSFRKNDIIKLVNKSYTPQGWLRGVLNGRKGLFPIEYVKPVGRLELTDISKHSVENAYVNESPNELDKLNHPLATIIEDTNNDELPLHMIHSDGHFSMMEFAMMNFKQSIEKLTTMHKIKSPVHGSSDVLQKLRDLRLRSANSREWTWSEYADMVKFSKSPMSTSLLKFDKPELTQLAVNCFIEIMRFMGDYPLVKNQKDIDCIYFLLQALHHHNELCDEVYCQIMKQTTNNKSTKVDSCQKGWRLMAIITAYYKASDVLKPYLFKYLESNAYDSKRPYNAIAQICLTSLRKTYKYGGRRNVPSQIELDALITGRVSKRQMFLLPGGVPILLNIRSCTVVQDCIEQICGHLGVQNSLEQYEFAIYYVVEAEKAARPLNRCEYIFDVITELTKLNNEFYLIFKRILWYYPLRLESDGYIDMMFNQILPDYVEGLVVVTNSNKLSSHLNNDVALLSALQFKANDKVGMPSMKEVKYLLPINVLDLKDLKPQQWVCLIHNKLKQLEHISVTQAKAKFLEVLQTWPLFGSTFFYVKNVFDTRIHGDCIMAINKLGVYFLNKENHQTILSFTFNEVISTRRYRAENNVQFVDLKCGNLMVQKVTRIETDQGNEISILIGQYIDLINRSQENNKPMGSFVGTVSNKFADGSASIL